MPRLFSDTAIPKLLPDELWDEIEQLFPEYEPSQSPNLTQQAFELSFRNVARQRAFSAGT